MNEHENKRTVDRRVALLALSSEQPDPAGPCLEAETLAALVEGRMAPEAVEACLAHIAGCENCYMLWLRLDQEWQQHRLGHRKTALLRLVRRPRILTTAGSLLAAAASIALMLSLPGTQDNRVDMSHLQQKTMPEPAMREPAAADSAAPQAKPSPAEQQAQPLSAQKSFARSVESAEPANTGVREQVEAESDRYETKRRDAGIAEKMASPAMARKQERKETKEKAVTPLAEQADTGQEVAAGRQDEHRQEAVGLSAASPAPPRMAASPPQTEQEKMPLTAEAWYARIRQGCQGTPRADFFSAIAAQGGQLLREPAALSNRDRQRIEGIVAELGKKPSAGGRCPVLLEFIEVKDREPQQ